MREKSCKHAHMRVHVHVCTCVVGQHLVVVGLPLFLNFIFLFFFLFFLDEHPSLFLTRSLTPSFSNPSPLSHHPFPTLPPASAAALSTRMPSFTEHCDMTQGSLGGQLCVRSRICI
jgi:hypothetical protein